MLIINTKTKNNTSPSQKDDTRLKKLEDKFIIEKLEAELECKNKESASNNSLHLLQKMEFLQKLKAELEKLRPLIENPDAKKEIQRIICRLDQGFQLNEEWEQFILHFDEVYNNFFKRLKKGYPKLTLKDYKLCAFLRMNLSTKEMAPLMNISIRGVEISRYRLRKKLDLEKDVNLNEFMMKY